MLLCSSQSGPDGNQPSTDKAGETKNPLFTARVRRILIALVAISFLAAFTSTGWEIVELTKGQIKGSTIGHLASVQGDQKKGPLPPVHPIYFMPKSLPGYTVVGRQKVRGEEPYAAEAIFKPEDEQYTLVEPLNVYAKIAYYGSNDAAQKAIDAVMNHRNIVDRTDINVGNVGTSAGYTEDRGSLVIAWIKNGFAVEVDASYTQIIPGEKSNSLEKNAVPVAKEIWVKMAGD